MKRWFPFLLAIVVLSPFAIAAPFIVNGQLSINGTSVWESAIAPTVATGFTGTGVAVTANNGSADFDINVGTGSPGSTGIITFSPVATTGWNCTCHDITTLPLVSEIRQTGGTNATADIANVTGSTGIALLWTASDHLRCRCGGF